MTFKLGDSRELQEKTVQETLARHKRMEREKLIEDDLRKRLPELFKQALAESNVDEDLHT